MKKCWVMLLLCCAVLVSAKDYVFATAGGDVMSASLDSSAEIKKVIIKTTGTAKSFQVWDTKKLQLIEIAGKINKISGGYEVVFASPVKTPAVVIRGKALKLDKISAVTVDTAAGKRELIVISSDPKGEKLIPDWNKDIATVLPGLIIFPGKEKRKQLTLASPNRLNRKDTGVIRLDLIDYIGKEQVENAVLVMNIVPWQALYPRMVEVGLLNEEQDRITVDTGFGHSAERVASLMLPFGPRLGALKVRLDITGDVNAALKKGISSLTWRLKDMHCVQQGNLRKRRYALSMPASHIYFIISE